MSELVYGWCGLCQTKTVQYQRSQRITQLWQKCKQGLTGILGEPQGYLAFQKTLEPKKNGKLRLTII